MKKYITKILVCVTLGFVSGCGHAKNALTAEEFALELKQIIASGSVKAFKDIPCFPTDCIDNGSVKYVFGAVGETSFIEKLINMKDLKIKVYGPYTYSDDAANQSYSLVYYDPNQVSLNQKGYMDAEVRKNMWWKGYVETVVIMKDGKWAFHYTPFYHGAHLPWAEDY